MWPLDDRREQLREIVTSPPDTIRFSETFNLPLSELMWTVRKHQLEGIVAKRAGSPYRSGERSADWLKWRANRGQVAAAGHAVSQPRESPGPLSHCQRSSRGHL